MRSMTFLESVEIEMDVINLDSPKSINDQVTEKIGGTLDILVELRRTRYVLFRSLPSS